MSIKLYATLAAAAALLAGGVAGGRYWGAQAEEKAVETCATGIRSHDTSKCHQRIIDAFSTIQLEAAGATIEYRDRMVPIQGASMKADLARLESLKDDLAAIAAQPVTSVCATAPAMVELRSQICAQTGDCQ
jgi:hypothetical protein